ncbi:ASCH domain-containing protein [Pseudomonas sp. B21-015]|uniref:ASCH domain-containing protein n=1 Tax=Pseudomonas sp. B21-015 TaxID=2895473 RepID=UPI00215E9304|nr:ASCH domain-containing protein [Pseudomonas sp. B21-015]UVM48599.1 ASCH domain-containing protein [Pseudomonas sp. B21-015]
MKALSIRQPWAWLIIHGGKDVENRSWHTKHRGRFLVHAAQGMTRAEYANAHDFALDRGLLLTPFELPSFEELQRGGIIGSVVLANSRDTSKSPWYMGEKAFLLADPKPLPFVRLKGRLNFFEVPDELVTP